MANITITHSGSLSSGTLGTHTLKAQRSTITATSSFADYSPTVTGSATNWLGGISVPYDFETDAKIRLINITSNAFCENTISNALDVDSRPTGLSVSFVEVGVISGSFPEEKEYDVRVQFTAPTNVGSPTSYDILFETNEEGLRSMISGLVDASSTVIHDQAVCALTDEDGNEFDSGDTIGTVAVRANYGGDSSALVEAPGPTTPIDLGCPA